MFSWGGREVRKREGEVRNMEHFLVCMQGRSRTVYIASLKALERMSQGSDVVRYVQYQHLLPLFEMS